MIFDASMKLVDSIAIFIVCNSEDCKRDWHFFEDKDNALAKACLVMMNEMLGNGGLW